MPIDRYYSYEKKKRKNLFRISTNYKYIKNERRKCLTNIVCTSRETIYALWLVVERARMLFWLFERIHANTHVHSSCLSLSLSFSFVLFFLFFYFPQHSSNHVYSPSEPCIRALPVSRCTR